MSDNKDDIRSRLKEVREKLNLSSSAFAEKAGINVKNYSSIETGGRTIGRRLLTDICAAHGINIEWLRDGVGNIFGDINISGNPHHIGNIGGTGNTAHMTINAWGYQKIIRDGYVELISSDSGNLGVPVGAEEIVKEFNHTQKELLYAKKEIDRKDKLISQYEAMIDRQAEIINKSNLTCKFSVKSK